MMKNRIVCLAFLILPLGSPGLYAQSPEETTQAFFEAMATGDWLRCAALTHPDALARFKGILIEIIEMDGSNSFLTIIYGDGVDRAAFQKLSPTKVYATLLKMVFESDPMLSASLAELDQVIIGHLDETDELTHVVYRMNVIMSGVRVTKLSVVSLQRHEDTWLLLLTGDMENMANAMKQQFAK